MPPTLYGAGEIFLILHAVNTNQNVKVIKHTGLYINACLITRRRWATDVSDWVMFLQTTQSNSIPTEGQLKHCFSLNKNANQFHFWKLFYYSILLLLKLRLLLLLNVLIREKFKKNCTILPNDFKQCLITRTQIFLTVTFDGVRFHTVTSW